MYAAKATNDKLLQQVQIGQSKRLVVHQKMLIGEEIKLH